MQLMPGDNPERRVLSALHCKTDGEFYDDCYHEKCAAILEAFCDEYKPHGEFSFDNVEDWLRDQCQDVCKKWQDCHCNIFRCEAIRSIPAIMEVKRRAREMEEYE